jgi:survival-of-motor-neuron-related-splicing factor 30
LSQVKLALAKEPNNTEYLNLKEELQSLIDLTKEYLSTQQPAAGSSSSSHTATTTTTTTTTTGGGATNAAKQKPGQSDAASTSSSSRANGATPSGRPAATAAAGAASHGVKFQTGDELLARYSGDGKFYPARITSIAGSDDTNLVYSVTFHGYSTTEMVAHADVKPLVDPKKRERELLQSKEDEEKERKRKKYEKKAVTKAEKTAEQGAKQKTWQSFAKKGAKKGIVIPGVQGELYWSSCAPSLPLLAFFLLLPPQFAG